MLRPVRDAPGGWSALRDAPEPSTDSTGDRAESDRSPGQERIPVCRLFPAYSPARVSLWPQPAVVRRRGLRRLRGVDVPDVPASLHDPGFLDRWNGAGLPCHRTAGDGAL